MEDVEIGKTDIVSAIIADSKAAIDAGAYMSALALVLTLPDICGKIEYGGGMGTGKRYRKWFDEFAKKHFPDLKPERFDAEGDWPVFDAGACYALRCQLLHSGGDNVDDDKRVHMDSFVLMVHGGPNDRGACVGCWVEGGQATHRHMRVYVDDLCSRLCRAARECYLASSKKEEYESRRPRFMGGDGA